MSDIRTSSRVSTDSKPLTKTKRLLRARSHHKEPGNKGDYSVSEPHQDLLLTKSGYLEPEVHHKEPENKGDYSVSEPHPDLLLTKSGYIEPEVHHKGPRK